MRSDSGALARAAERLRSRCTRLRADDGFTMAEMLIAIMILGIVMASFAMFFVRTVSATTQQTISQAGVQLADDAIERAKAVPGSGVITGRDATSVTLQWSTADATAKSYRYSGTNPTGMADANDASASGGAGATASLPTSPKSVTINNLTYQQNWFVGSCWEPVGGGTCSGASSTDGSGNALVAYYKVVVEITWPDKTCSSGTCSYFSTTLVSAVTSDPVFVANGVAQAPVITNPGNQTSEQTVADSLQMTATGGAPPLVWAASGLPAGFSISTTTGLISGTPTTTGTASVVVTATDGFNLIGTAAFNWTINSVLTLTNPGNKSGVVGAAVSFTPTSGGGVPAYAWVATGLPAGLTIDAGAGTISGTPTAAGPNAVTITDTDSEGKAVTVAFTWTIYPALVATNQSTQRSITNTTISSVQMTATGGSGTYTNWSATGLPTGLTLNASTGVISGKPTVTGSYSVVVTVTDSAGNTDATNAFTWVVAPTLAAANQPTQYSDVTVSDSLTMTATGGISPYTWSASGLPAGLSINSSTGVISGTPTTAGTSTVTVTVTDSTGATDSTTPFSWVVAAKPVVTNPTTATRTNAHGSAITSFTATATGGSGTLAWSATGLPAGISINASTGVVSGTPTTANGSGATVKITVTDSAGVTASVTFTWKVT